jgi:hypothetical protein
MTFTVDFTTVSTVGLESSPVAAALAGLRANEARYFKNKYDHVFTVEPASDAQATIDWVHRILKEERDIIISSRPLEATEFQVENIRMAYVFYESGLSINVMYTVDDAKKRAVGFKLSDGMEVPAELASQFKVREAEVEAGRNHSRLLLQPQERVLTPDLLLTDLETAPADARLRICRSCTPPPTSSIGRRDACRRLRRQRARRLLTRRRSGQLGQALHHPGLQRLGFCEGNVVSFGAGEHVVGRGT